MRKRLTRIKEGEMIGGVATGLARYFDIDVSIVRLIFLFMALGEGAGVLVYLVMWLILPPAAQIDETTWQENVRMGAAEMRNRAHWAGDEIGQAMGHGDSKTVMIVGGALVAIGVLMVLRNFVPWLGWTTLWPVALIGLGIVMLLRR